MGYTMGGFSCMTEITWNDEVMSITVVALYSRRACNSCNGKAVSRDISVFSVQTQIER